MSSPKSALDDLRIDRPVAAETGSRGRFVIVILAGVAALAAGFWWFSRSRALEVRTVMVREAASSGGGSSPRAFARGTTDFW